MIPRKLVCGSCGHVHRFPGGFTTSAPLVVVGCDRCGARIDLRPRRFFRWVWPTIVTRPKRES